MGIKASLLGQTPQEPAADSGGASPAHPEMAQLAPRTRTLISNIDNITQGPNCFQHSHKCIWK